MPTPPKYQLQAPEGVDVRFAPHRDMPHVLQTYRVTPQGHVFVHCHFTNWQPFTNSRGVKPGGKWVQFRKMPFGSKTAREARELAAQPRPSE